MGPVESPVRDVRPNKYTHTHARVTHGYAYTRLRARVRMGVPSMHVCTHSWVRGCIYIYVWRSLLAPNSYVDVVCRDRMAQNEYLLCIYVAVGALM